MSKTPKPIIHRRDHEHGGADPIRIAWESVGDGDGGGGPTTGIFFDTDPQEGEFLVVSTTGDTTFTATGADQNFTIDAEHSWLYGEQEVSIVCYGTGGILLKTYGEGDILLMTASGSSSGITIEIANLLSGGYLAMVGLPTASPGGNKVWRDGSGYLRIG